MAGMKKLGLHKAFSMLLLLLGLYVQNLYAQDGADLLYREGSSRFERGDYQGAAERYNDFLHRFPGNEHYPDALYRLGIAKIKTDNYSEGIDLLKRLESRYPSGRFRSSFWIAMAYDKAGGETEAREYWDRYLETGDTLYRKEALLSSAYIRRDMENSSEAEKMLLELQTLNRSFFTTAGGLELLGDLYAREKRWDDLTALGDASLSTGGDIPPRFVLRYGEACSTLGQGDKAEELFISITEGPGSEAQAAAYGWLFSIYEESGRYQDMEQMILDAEERLAGDRPALAGFWFRAGAVLSGGDNPARGLGYLKRAWDVRTEADLPGTLPLFYARALTESGDIEEAAGILQTAMDESFGDPVRLAYNLAILKATGGNWLDAEALLTPVEDQLSPGGALLLAKTYMNLGLYTAGLHSAGAALERTSSSLWQIELLNIIWQLQATMGQYDAAVKSYAQMVRLKGDSGEEPDLKYARLLFNARLYDQVLRKLPEEGTLPEVRVLRGLSLVGVGEYTEARSVLQGLVLKDLSDEYASLAAYYIPWCAYRLGDYPTALKGFGDFRRLHPDHANAAEAIYFGGWAAFSMKQFSTAAELFGAYPQNGPRGSDVLFARAKALAAAGSDGEALLLVEKYLDGTDSRDKRSEALYLIFDIHLENMDFTGAAQALSRFESEKITGTWYSRSLYRLGKAEFDQGRFPSSAALLDRYRKLYPRGDNAAQVLYYRAEAAVAMKEVRLALLLWDRMIKEYPDSRLRPEALSRRAGILVSLGEYREALDSYSSLIAEYPARAASLGAGDEVKRLEALLVSASSEYERLKKEADRAGGSGTAEGRALLIKAVHSAIVEGRAEAFADADRVVQQLMEVNSVNSREKGEIIFLAGEYRFRQNEYTRAASLYLEAASTYTADPDFTAEALYRSAQMSLYAGDRLSYLSVIDRLKRMYPESTWLEAAQKLEGQL